MRSGAILPKIPDDVMTLVPGGEFADKGVKSMDSRRVYELYPGTLEAIHDFEGRSIESTGEPMSLTVTGAPAHIILRWRFAGPRTATVSGRTVSPVRQGDGAAIEFDHRGHDQLALIHLC